jgi:hypothetical protein
MFFRAGRAGAFLDLLEDSPEILTDECAAR